MTPVWSLRRLHTVDVALIDSLAERLGPDATVVTLMCDSGMKYLSGDLYKNN